MDKKETRKSSKRKKIKNKSFFSRRKQLIALVNSRDSDIAELAMADLFREQL